MECTGGPASASSDSFVLERRVNFEVTSVVFGDIILPPNNYGGVYKAIGLGVVDLPDNKVGNCFGIACIKVFLIFSFVTAPSSMTSKLNISVIIEPVLEVGTRPHWDAETQSYYFVDVPTSYVYKYHPATQVTVKAKVGTEPLGFMFPIEGSTDKFVAGLGRKFVTVTWNGVSSEVSSVEIIGEVDAEQGYTENRLNGGKVDPFGRLWAGTMGPSGTDGNVIPKRGSLYSVTSKTIKKHESEIGISNGLAWNVEKGKMYYIDTLFPGVYQYDYDGETGEISNRTVIFEFKRYNISGQPDGLTIDTEGKLWVACIHGSTIIRIDPETKTLLQTVELPTSQITALCFGSRNLDVLFVTSARMFVNQHVPEYPAGCSITITGLHHKGYAGDLFKL